MREILFRGQTRKYGEKVRMDGSTVESHWVYGGIFQGSGDFSIIYTGSNAEEFEKFAVYSETVGQYTGLQDENGTMIFENDILEVENTFNNSEKDTHGYLLVSFMDDAFVAGRNPLSYWLFDSIPGNRRLSRAKVCGNKFDNPELMEVNNEST